MLNWRKLAPLFLALFCLAYYSNAQVTIDIIILDGTADSDCTDFVGAADHVWSVNINDEGWLNYNHNNVCDQFQNTPHTQYSITFDCPSDVVTSIPICFRAFENDPGVTNPCSTIRPDNCIAEICNDFDLPLPGESRNYVLRISDNADASGQVEFRITADASFASGLNDIPCTAMDLGLVSVGETVGDASRGNLTNYCGTKNVGEPDPISVNAGWGNNVGVWYSFRTTDTPGDRFVVKGTSDPENVGDPIFLQIGLYESSDNTCSGDFIYLGGSGRSRDDTSLSENINISCDRPLKPNATYFLLVDGVVDTQEELYGVFGLEVQAISNTPTILNETLCAGQGFRVFNKTYRQTGNYADTMRLASNCDSIVLTNLTVLESLRATANQNNIATGINVADGGATITITGGTGDYTVEWSDGGIGVSRDDLLGDVNYQITITDSNGCTTQTAITVQFTVLLVARISSDTLNCFGDTNGRLVIVAENGEPPYDYSWRSLIDDNLQGSGTIRTAGGVAGITDLPAGNYEVRIDDGFSPELILSSIVVEPAELLVNVNNEISASCFGICDAQFTLEVQGGTMPYNYDIPPTNFDLNTSAVQNLCAGNFTSLVTDAKGCITMLNATLEEPEEFIIAPDIIQNVSCFEGSNGAISLSSNGNPATYIWNNGATTQSITDLTAGNYSVTVTNQNGCEDELQVNINQPSQPLEVDIQVEAEISCFGANDGVLSAKLEDDNIQIAQYTWSNGASTAQITDLVAGTYLLMIEDVNGCTATNEISIQQPEELQVAFSTQDIGCLDSYNAGTIFIDGINGGTAPYRVSTDGVLFSNREQISSLEEGIYDLIVQDAKECEWTSNVEIMGPPEISVNLGDDLVIKLGETVDLTAFTNSENPIFSWQSEDTLSCTNCASLKVQPFDKTNYIVQVIDSVTQCTASDRITVLVDRQRDVYIPNVFSPNSNQNNNSFTVYGGNAVSSIKSLRIFTRKGDLVFERFNFLPNDEASGWNGLFNGERLSPAVFVYAVEVEFIDNEVIVYGGDVALVR